MSVLIRGDGTLSNLKNKNHLYHDKYIEVHFEIPEYVFYIIILIPTCYDTKCKHLI